MIVLDNVIHEDVFEKCKENLLGSLKESTREIWFDLDAKFIYSDFCLSLINLANSYYDLSSCDGYEFWAHKNTKPPRWHIDCDERRKQQDNLMTFPLCSIVYYPFVGDITGGELFISHDDTVKSHSDYKNFKDTQQYHMEENPTFDTIIPKTNRVVIFSPGKFHMVNKFQGERYSFVINPWDSSKYMYPETIL